MRPQFQTKKRELDHKASSVPFELKALSEDGTFEGYGSMFNNVDRGKDTIVPGAFRQTLAGRDLNSIKMLRDHDSTKICGQWLEMREDDRGLKVKGKLFVEDGMSTPLAQETYVLMKSGALSALSIGYRTVQASYDESSGIRELKELELWEVSVVPFPMNELATVDAVKRDVSKQDVERILREAGVPNQFAKMVAVHGYDGAKERLGSQREAGSGDELEQMLRNTIESLRN